MLSRKWVTGTPLRRKSSCSSSTFTLMAPINPALTVIVGAT